MPKINELKEKRDFIKLIVQNNSKISYGGTSSGVIALAAAKAAQQLQSDVFYCTVFVSPLIYINSAHIGVPGLGRCGMKKIIAAGLVSKKPELGLHVLSSLTTRDIVKVEELSKNPTLVNVEVQYNTGLIYCRVIAVDNQSNVVDVKIEEDPTYFTSIKINNKETIDAERATKRIQKMGFENFDEVIDYVSIKDAYEICKTIKLPQLKFLDKHIEINKNICDMGLKEPKKDSIHYHYVEALEKLAKLNAANYSNDSWMYRLCSNITAGIDARMNGAPCPTITSATNGDHGIVAVMVPYYYAQEFNVTKEKMYQAILLSHFITWRISQKIGTLTVMCGTAIAAIAGAIVGIAFMQDKKWEEVERILNMHLCQQAGTLCFGSSPSCSLKVLSSLIAGIYCMEYASLGGQVPSKDGIIHEDIEQTLNNLKKYTEGTNATAVTPIVESYLEADKGGK